MTEREEMLNTIRYFWEAKEDLERWTGFDRGKLNREFPEIIKAWEDYKASKAVLTAVINGVR